MIQGGTVSYDFKNITKCQEFVISINNLALRGLSCSLSPSALQWLQLVVIYIHVLSVLDDCQILQA